MEKTDNLQSLVSIIVPMYNCQEYIERCIRSLLKQNYHNVEILIIDDGSTDAGAGIVKEYANKHHRIKYIYQENSGPGVARNRGIEQAKGKYILFVDSDDYVSKVYIENMVNVAERYDSELVIAGYTLVYADKKKKIQIVPERYIRQEAEEWAYRISACCSRLYLKEFWEKNRLQFSEDRNARAEDVPIALFSNAMAKNITTVKEPGYFYYQHSESAMNNKKKKVLFDFPYQAFRNAYDAVKAAEIQNSQCFFDFGVLKFLAQFDLVIYRKASLEEKVRFREYINELIGKEFEEMVLSWEKIKKKIDLPIVHKVCIQFFIFKYKNWCMKKNYKIWEKI